MERSGLLLTRAAEAFSVVSEANTNPTLQAVKAALAPQYAAQHDAIYLDAKLFARVSALHARGSELHLDPESQRLLDYTYEQFVRSGANLRPADKATLRRMNEEISTLSDEFSRKLLAANAQAAFHTGSRGGARGTRGGASGRRGAGREGTRCRRLSAAVAEHHTAAGFPVAAGAGDAAGHFRELHQPRGAG